MDNAQKAIMIGVSVFITIAIVTTVILITGIGSDAMNNGNQRIEGVSSSVASQLLASYDVKELSGANVISSIKKFYDKENFVLCVDDTSSKNFYSTLKVTATNNLKPSMSKTFTNTSFSTSDLNNYYGVILKTGTTLISNTPNIDNIAANIKSTNKYMAYIIYFDGTDSMLGVYFRKII